MTQGAVEQNPSVEHDRNVHHPKDLLHISLALLIGVHLPRDQRTAAEGVGIVD